MMKDFEKFTQNNDDKLVKDTSDTFLTSPAGAHNPVSTDLTYIKWCAGFLGILYILRVAFDILMSL